MSRSNDRLKGQCHNDLVIETQQAPDGSASVPQCRSAVNSVHEAIAGDVGIGTILVETNCGIDITHIIVVYGAITVGIAE